MAATHPSRCVATHRDDPVPNTSLLACDTEGSRVVSERTYGLNAHLLDFGASYRAAGISRSIQNLLRFAPAECTEAEHLIGFTGPGAIPDWLGSAHLTFAQSRLPTRRPYARILWEQLALPIATLRFRLSALHCPAYAMPVVRSVPTVVTVHDLSFLRFPAAFNRGNRLYLSAMTRRSARRADALIAVSEATREGLVALLGVERSRVSVIPHGIEPEFRPLDVSLVTAFRRERGLLEGYILCVSTLEPRKNLGTLIRAYAMAGGFGRLGRRLVLAGGKGWGYEDIFRLVEELDLGSDVLFPGYVPMSDLPLWYNAADLFVYPSRYEGFGMPVLEAMACGVPTITTTASALREVAGAACLLFDPDDAQRLSELIRSALESPALLGELREAGLRRAADFSWQRSAQLHLGIYRALSG